MAEAQMAGSHYESDGQGDAEKLLINFYPEFTGADPSRSLRLVNTPGSRIIDDGTTLSGVVRGMTRKDGYLSGDLAFVDGTTFRRYNPSTDSFSTLTGTVAGSDRVQFAIAQAEGGLVGNGDFYVTTDSAVAAASDGDWATLLSDHGQTAFTSITAFGQRAILTYGARIAYSEAVDFNNTTTLNWYTAESDPDDLVCTVAIGNILWLCGTESMEPWIETGDNDVPLTPISGGADARCLAFRDSVVKLDGSFAFIADDLTVRVMRNRNPEILGEKETWVTRLLEGVSDLSTVYCYAHLTEGHTFYVINAPSFCIAYDFATQQWTKRETKDENTWEWGFLIKDKAKIYAGSRLGAKLVELSRDYKSDDQPDASTVGTYIERTFTAHLPSAQTGFDVESIRLEGTKGVGLASGASGDTDPEVTLYISRNKGISYDTGRSVPLGAIGEYETDSSWFMNGGLKPEMTVLKFVVSAAVNFLPSRVAINEL